MQKTGLLGLLLSIFMFQNTATAAAQELTALLPLTLEMQDHLSNETKNSTQNPYYRIITRLNIIIRNSYGRYYDYPGKKCRTVKLNTTMG
ncbi:hypothetical protein DDU33_02770 [Actinobacillus porcitonsillarum]|uniref:Uncharacterized protein n=1 Tax=Actinobacillus porcitonsillarum TaxID=189834 RepID=A0A2U8FIZ8_9PAST|nr:hypothetical protein DDU33_02770 [Actinobacillus porcitonsillarum]